MSMRTETVKRYSKTDPCPVCETGTKGCSLRDNGAIFCRGEPVDARAWLCVSAEGEFKTYQPTQNDGRPKPRKIESRKPTLETKKLQERFLEAINQKLLLELATKLGLPVESLRGHEIGYDLKHQSWSFPEQDEKGNIVGFSLRSRRGKKFFVDGMSRGLFLPPDKERTTESLYLVEGYSDTIAGYFAGLPVVGRPSNLSVVHIDELLASDPFRKIFFVAENDRKKDGKWPGLEGAIASAAKLAEKVTNPVFVVRVGDDKKDAREFLTSRPESESWEDRGKRFVEELIPIDWRGLRQENTDSGDGDRIVDGTRVTAGLFAVWNRKTCSVTLGRDEDGKLKIQKATELANFVCKIAGESITDDGAETRRMLTLLVEKSGSEALQVEIPAAEFAGMDWVMKHCGPDYIPAAGSGKRDSLRAATQELSAGKFPRRKFFGHTGWTEVNSEPVFLHAGGGIGKNGTRADVKTSLSGAGANFVFPDPPTGDRLRQAVAASLRILSGLIPDQVAFPLLGSIYRAPLGSVDYGLFLYGLTNSFKSELVALGQQHFGKDMGRLNLPGSWRSTANGLEALTFILKDVLQAIDDFNPTGSKQDIDRMHRTAEEIFRSAANHSGRLRMNHDLTSRASRPPRGLIIASGEMLPRGHSLSTRIFAVEVLAHEVNKSFLTAAQRDGSSGLYAESMAGYVQWLAGNFAAIRAGLQAEREVIRAQFMDDFPKARTPEIVANILLGLRYFFDFSVSCGAISASDRESLLLRARQTLKQSGQEQSENHSANDPVHRFAELIQSAVSSGKAHIAGVDGKVPAPPLSPLSPLFLGWRESLARTDSAGGAGTFIPSGSKIGWIKENELYLDPDAMFSTLSESLSRQGETMPLTKNMYLRHLKNNRILLRWEEGKTTHRTAIEGSDRRPVLVFNAPSLLGFQGQQGQQGQDSNFLEKSEDNDCPCLETEQGQQGQESQQEATEIDRRPSRKPRRSVA